MHTGTPLPCIWEVAACLDPAAFQLLAKSADFPLPSGSCLLPFRCHLADRGSGVHTQWEGLVGPAGARGRHGGVCKLGPGPVNRMGTASSPASVPPHGGQEGFVGGKERGAAVCSCQHRALCVCTTGGRRCEQRRLGRASDRQPGALRGHGVPEGVGEALGGAVRAAAAGGTGEAGPAWG